METDQELFAKGLATYQKVMRQNYMAHREVYGLLHDVLVSEAPKPFVFLDIACGTATGSARALQGTNVAGYIGIDISRPSLEAAGAELNSLACPIDLRCQNFVEALNAWDEPVHVIWIGQSRPRWPMLSRRRICSLRQAIIERRTSETANAGWRWGARPDSSRVGA